VSTIITTANANLRAEVEDVARHTSPGGDITGLRGTVTVYFRPDLRVVYGVSRLYGSDDWVIDSRFRNGVPMHVNGFGARYLRTDSIVDVNIIAALDDAAVAA